MTKVAFISLGCSKNLVDTEVMLHNLYKDGFEVTFEPEEAEIRRQQQTEHEAYVRLRK